MKWRSMTAAAFLLCALAQPAAAQGFGGRLVASRAAVDQSGVGNAAAITQNGASNDAAIVQVGRNNAGAISQDGNNNQACLIQFGRNLDAAVIQTGDNNRIGVLQGRRGVREISPDACRAANRSYVRFMMGRRGR